MTQRRRGPAPSPSRLSLVALARAAAAGLAGPLALAGAASGLAGCVQDPMPFDPRTAQNWERRDDDSTRARKLYPLPTTQQFSYAVGPDGRPTTRRLTPIGESRDAPAGPGVRMSLQEVIHRSVANNLDIRVAGFDTAIDQTRVLEAAANFDPTFFSDVSFEDVNKQVGGGDAFTVKKGTDLYSNNASSGAFIPFISRVDKEALTVADAGFRQNLEAGGKISLTQNVNNSWFYPTRSLLNPYFENDLVLQLTQPLLQNFGVAVNEARITIARNTQRVSLLEFRKTVEETVLKVEQTYWELVQTERDVATSRRLIGQSEQVAELLHARAQRGSDITQGQVQQANAQTDARRVNLIAEQSRVDALSDQLKQLMNDPAYPVSGNAVILPSDDFQNDPVHFNLNDQVEAALENRLELGEQQVRIESAEIAVDVARNGLLPSLTLQLAGTVDGLARTINGAFNNEGQFNHLGYQAGLQFELPIGNRAARAVWQRALLQRLQAIAGYGSEEEKVTLDVRNAARDVSTAYERLAAAHNSVLGFQKVLESLQAQIRSGDAQLSFGFVFDLLNDQEQLAAQEQAEHLAQNDYNYAIAELEGAKGTLLRYNNVIMEQEQLPFDLELPGEPAALATPPGYPYPDHVTGPLGR